MDISAEIKKLNKMRVIFGVTVLILTFGTLFYTGICSLLPYFLKNIDSFPKPVYLGFLISMILISVEFIGAWIGTFLFLKTRRPNPFLLCSLILMLFEYKVYEFKFTLLLLELGFTFNIGIVGIGINFVGIILLGWYLYIWKKNITLKN